jgi:hypothetical protein
MCNHPFFNISKEQDSEQEKYDILNARNGIFSTEV